MLMMLLLTVAEVGTNFLYKNLKPCGTVSTVAAQGVAAVAVHA